MMWAQVICFLGHLLKADDKQVDSIILMGALGIIALIAFQGIVLFTGGPSTFGPVSFAAGISAIIGAIGGGKRWRDGASSKPEDK